jgi:hypothetical protein
LKKDQNTVNRWNLFHVLPPFAAIFTAAKLLGNRPDVHNYEPGLYLLFSTLFACIAILALLLSRETVKNFLLFLPTYPVWLFAAIAPTFYDRAVPGALTSAVLILMATVMQHILSGLSEV